MLEEQDLKILKQMIDESVKSALPVQEDKTPKKRGRPAGKKTTLVKKAVKKPAKKAKSRKKGVDSDENSSYNSSTAQMPKIRRIVNSVKNSPRDSGETSHPRGSVHAGRNRAIIESFKPVANRPNLFLKWAEAKMFKQDSAIDKKLSGNNQAVPRRPTIEMAEVECCECGKPYVVSESLLNFDPDDGSVRYTCDSCIRR